MYLPIQIGILDIKNYYKNETVNRVSHYTRKVSHYTRKVSHYTRKVSHYTI